MFAKDQIVKYAQPVNAHEAALRFIVIENRETRLLVGSILSEEDMKKFPFGLTECYAIEQYEAA